MPTYTNNELRELIMAAVEAIPLELPITREYCVAVYNEIHKRAPGIIAEASYTMTSKQVSTFMVYAGCGPSAYTWSAQI